MADDPYKEGTSKLAMAQQAALLSVEELTPRDLIGVVAFDSFQHWLLPVASVRSSWAKLTKKIRRLCWSKMLDGSSRDKSHK